MIGKNIYEIRKRRGLTLTELAERAGIAKSYLSNIERNLNQNPSINVIEKISNVLQVDLKTLLSFDTSAQAENSTLDSDWIELAKELKDSGLDKADIEEYKTLIEFIKWRSKK